MKAKEGNVQRKRGKVVAGAPRDPLAFSVVDHLRWDVKQIFDMAVGDGIVERNSALQLFTPKDAPLPVKRVMSLEEVQKLFAVLDLWERLRFPRTAGLGHPRITSLPGEGEA